MSCILENAPSRNMYIGARFGAAAGSYTSDARVQREIADELARRIAELPLPAAPRILEVGCGTGFLSAALRKRLAPASWTITDIAPEMVATVEQNFSQPGFTLPGDAQFRVMDGEHPDMNGPYDLICSSMAVQWFGNLNAGLTRLSQSLAPGGWLVVATLAEDTFGEWHAAHAAHGLKAAVARYPQADCIGRSLPGMRRELAVDVHVEKHRDGLAFLRSLRAIGATSPTVNGRSPLSAGMLRNVLRTFEEQGASVSYQVAYGIWNKVKAPRGVFVSGTDTGIGKTLVSSVLARAWQADYWKPLQTGVAEEAGDSETMAALSGLTPDRIHPPHAILQAPLSPWDAARAEGTVIDMDSIELPVTDAPLVVEGAGGLLVPITDEASMIDLAMRLGLPVVLVARSQLGTINHTLLSLEALRARGVPVAGVVLSGPLSPGNRHAIEQLGKVCVLGEIPALAQVDAATVVELAKAVPPLDVVLAEVNV